ncbi:MAG: hypothetical protein PHE25_04345 [Candidatus Gracilibacteria bacterium]|nr:hypothetical protein [Candidatus Gracilibacteria bacterium]
MFLKITKIIFKSGEKYFLFLFLAVFLSLFSYSLGNNIILSVKDYLQSQIKPLVGGDLVLSSKYDFKNENYLEKYKNNFEIAKTIGVNSTIFDSKKNPVLVNLIYHTPNYPFYNQFEFDILNNSGSLIIDETTYEKFGKNIEILGKNYAVKGIIKKSPIGDVSVYTSQNNIYLPINNFDNTLNSTNSRLEYKYYFKFKTEINKNLLLSIKNDINLKDFRIKTLDDRNENISNITDRFYVFINFFDLIVFILTFFIIILSLEIFFKKIKGIIALLNIFGLKKRSIFYYNFLILFGIFIFSFLFAYFINIGVMYLFALKYDFFTSKLESFYKGFFITIILLIVGFFSPIYKIFKSDIGVLLNDNNNFSNFDFKDYIIYLGLIFIGFLGINLISGIEINNSFLYSFGFIIVIILFYILIEYLLKYIFKFLKHRLKSFYLFDAIRSTIKPGNVSFLIILSGIISFISIFIFYVFSGSFLSYLQNITKNSNDTFVINVQEKDQKVIKKYFLDSEIYEIVSLKITKINGKTLEQFLNTSKVSREFSREFFSTTNNLDNKILYGNKLTSSGVSVDIDFANNLGLKIGDEIIFSVAGLDKTLKVQNFRESVRNGANPFFYFMLLKSDFINYPKNYILSYKEISKPKNIENVLSKEVGNYLTFIKTKQIIDIVINITNQILVVIYLCLFYIFIFSFLSFIVSITFLSTFKNNKIKLLNTLGGNKSKLINALNIEFGYLVFVGLLFSLIFGVIFLEVIFHFIKYFSLDFLSLFIGILIIFGLFLINIIYLKFFYFHKVAKKLTILS